MEANAAHTAIFFALFLASTVQMIQALLAKALAALAPCFAAWTAVLAIAAVTAIWALKWKRCALLYDCFAAVSADRHAVSASV